MFLYVVYLCVLVCMCVFVCVCVRVLGCNVMVIQKLFDNRVGCDNMVGVLRNMACKFA